MKVGQIFYTCASSTTLFTVFWWEFFSFPFTSLSFHFNWQIFRTLVFLKEDFSGTSRYCSYHTELIVFFFKFKLSICTRNRIKQKLKHSFYKNNTGHKTLLYDDSSLYNNQPKPIAKNNSFNTFKRNVKEHFLNQKNRYYRHYDYIGLLLTIYY